MERGLISVEQPRSGPLRRGPAILLLAVVYVAAGRLGLGLDALSGFATLVWAPTGISLAALLFFGVGLWPGVFLGALAVNLWAGAAVPLAAGIAVGNTLEAVFAVYVLKRIPGFALTLERVRDVLSLIVVGAMLSTVLSATIGVLSLSIAGVVSPERVAVTWLAWWVGDAVADLVVAPLLLVWLTPRGRSHRPRELVETASLAVCLLLVTSLVFGTAPPNFAFTFLQPYLLSPLLIWAALRFEVRGAATAIFTVSVIAVWGTAQGLGPFTGNELYVRLAALQAFMAITALTFLILGAVAAERLAAERELTVAMDAAQAASRAKSRFLAVVSHELRTPLAGIVGYADLLLENIGGRLSEMHREYVTRMRGAAWHLGSIIEGILTFARGEIGHDNLRMERADARVLLQETAELLEPQIAAKQLSFRVIAPEEPVLIRSDLGKLRQILFNLVGNAVKFTHAGAIELQLRRENGTLVFTVTDTGPGIPDDQLDRIFEPFTQVSNSDPQLPGGTGLGLAISRMLAEALGGSLSVESQLGHGATFTLEVPAGLDAADHAI